MKFAIDIKTLYTITDNICKRYGLNKLSKEMKETKRKIIKEKAGDLALPKELLENTNQRYYLLGVFC